MDDETQTLTKDDREEFQTLEAIAELGWQAHLAWENIIGELPQLSWDQLSREKQQEICDLTRWVIEHPYASIALQHDNWRALKATKGKSLEGDPNMDKWENLPFSQQRKAFLWRHIVHAIVG